MSLFWWYTGFKDKWIITTFRLVHTDILNNAKMKGTGMVPKSGFSLKKKKKTYILFKFEKSCHWKTKCSEAID